MRPFPAGAVRLAPKAVASHRLGGKLGFMNLSRFPRVPLARLPTPIEPLDRLTAHLGGPKIYVKRDDETGLGLGGNKLRKLEFLLGEARAQGADVVLTVGAMQSNHARQTAAACARLGLACELILRRSRQASEAYLSGGNVLLDRLLGASITVLDADASREDALALRVQELQRAGRHPYAIPVGGSSIRGCLGYATCAEEILTQSAELGVKFAAVIVATGSGGTHAGLLAGLHALGSDLPVIGIAIEGTRPEQERLVFGLAAETAHALSAARLGPERVTVLDDYAGAGYARPTDDMREALHLAAGFEGLVLDPVYTGKAFAGLIDMIRKRRFTEDSPVLFLHTGGAPGLFAYADALA
jgi:L-cysteate sulfo-lyase